ncbi:MAG: glycosyl transferase family 1 [Blastomonas sp.]|nr:glycosyl transferase family 1 [Blastomonas sp.]|tara:strand:- start:1437 stop:2147 length:711 start_codon:yes stop_codon:yes gene_type:complete
MKIFISAKEQESLSASKREKIEALIRNEGIVHVCFYDSVQSNGAVKDSEDNLVLNKSELLFNLVSLQRDALLQEERLGKLNSQNEYLERKINWLRSKSGEESFIPSKEKPNSNHSLNNSSLQPALIKVINAMESEASRRKGLSFPKSKRARRDKALIAKSEYFDIEYVASQLKQLGLEVKDPLEFFVSFGTELELSPSVKFDTKSYLAMYPDVKDSGINPLLHYIKHGKAEGRVLI